MGRDKALLPWQDQTFLGIAIDRLNACSEIVIVVGGANAALLRPIVYAKSAFLLENPEPERGQFTSLRIGVQAILNRGRDAGIITLVDRPPAAATTFALLRRTFEREYGDQTWVVVPEYQGRHGHPIVIGREMIECFLRADAARTAREVMHAHQEKILYVPVDDALVVANVDTPEEFANLQPVTPV